MKLFFKNVLAAPVFPGDEDRTHHARQLNTVITANILLFVVAFAALLLSGKTVSPLMLAICAALLGALWLMRRAIFLGRLLLVSYILVLAPSLALTHHIYMTGTTRSPLVAGYVLVVVMAGLLLRRGAMLAVMLLCVAEYTLLMLLNAAGLLKPIDAGLPVHPIINDWVVFVPLLVYTGLFTWFMQQNIYALLDRARREVAERKRVEEALRRSHDFFQGVINALEDPVLVKDAQQRYIMLNESACALLGRPFEELIGRGDGEYFAPEVADQYGKQDRMVLDTGQTAVYEEQILIDYEPRTIATKKSRYIDPATGERFIAASIRDITDRRRMEEALEQSRSSLEQQVLERTGELIAANRTLLDEINERRVVEDALRESEQRYRALVEASPDFIVVFDEQMRVLYANPSLLAYAQTEDFHLYIPPEGQAWLQAFIQDFLGSGLQVSNTVEYSFAGPDGVVRWFSGVLARIVYQSRPGLLAIARDVTERKQTEAALAQSQERMRALLDASTDLSFLVDPRGRFLAVNQAAVDFIGLSREQLLRTNLYDLMPDELRETRRQHILEVARTGKPARFEDMAQGRWTDNSVYPVFAADGSVELLAIFSRDITKRKRAEEELRLSEATLRKSEERYALAARGANDALWDYDVVTGSLYLSPRCMQMLGYGDDHFVTRIEQWMELIHPEDRERAAAQALEHLDGRTPHYESEYRARSADGSYRWVLSRGLAVRDAEGVPYRAAGSITDISERKRIEARLLHDALHDSATGLPNRALLADRLEQAIKTQRRQPGTRFAVLYMDLDRFKDINDSLGHSVGDQLLVAVAQRVQGCLRETDTLARLGGDEFVILLPMVAGVDEALGVAERIQSALRQPFDLNGLQSYTSASIGIVISDGSRGGSAASGMDGHPAVGKDGSHAAGTGALRAERVRSGMDGARAGGMDGAHAGGMDGAHAECEEMLRDADIAMYRAKALGRARCAVFDASMHSQIMQRMRLETDLRRAISEGRLEIHYMPIVSLNGGHAGRCESFEALVRWRHPQRGLIPPAEFIPLAEESLLIIPLDRWVLREACRQLQAWQERWPELLGLKINVNLSSKQFAQPDLIEQITSTLSACELSPSCLRLEITESAIIENIELANRTLRHLQELGVQVEIDDFGTGFSALTYLYQLPVNTLKIDRSFTNQLGVDPRKTEIVRTLVSLAHNIGLDVVAEGVETPEQVERLKGMHCDYGQGFLFAKPMAVDEVERYMKSVVH